MDNQTLPMFSEYQRLRLINPNAYWSTKTQTEMTRAYQQHGMPFFDLRKVTP